MASIPHAEGNVRDRLRGRQDANVHGLGLGACATTGRERFRALPSQQAIQLVLERLGRDPALRFDEQGRSLLRLFRMQADITASLDRVADTAPPHCRESLAEAARQYAASWRSLADAIERKNRGA